MLRRRRILRHGSRIGRGRGEPDSGARLQQRDDTQPDRQGRGRHDLEIDQRAQTNPADVLHRAHVGNADNDGREHNWRDHHFDELDEAVAQRFHGRCPFGRHESKQHSERDPGQYLEVQAGKQQFARRARHWHDCNCPLTHIPVTSQRSNLKTRLKNS